MEMDPKLEVIVKRETIYTTRHLPDEGFQWVNSLESKTHTRHVLILYLPLLNWSLVCT